MSLKTKEIARMIVDISLNNMNSFVTEGYFLTEIMNAKQLICMDFILTDKQ